MAHEVDDGKGKVKVFEFTVSYDNGEAQLEKIQNEPDYRKKVDFAVDAIMAIYNEEERLRRKQDDPRGMSYEYFQNIMISLFDKEKTNGWV